MDAGERHAIVAGDLVVDLDAHEASVGGLHVPLTHKEFGLLGALASRPGWVLSKEQLLQQVWDCSYVGDTRLITVHVGNLRRKLEDAGAHGYLQTVRGAGYRLQKAEPTVLSTVTTAVRADRGSLVGRVEQLASLQAAYSDVIRQDRGTAVLVSGEAGIGKTRLVEELAAWVADADGLVLWGRSIEDEGSPPYWPWTLMLRRWIEANDQEAFGRILEPRAAGIAWLAPELAVLAPRSSLEGLSADAATRFRMFDGVASFLRVAAAERPLVLTLDDLHDADRASLELLEHLTHELRSMRILVVATSRESDVRADHPLSRVLADLAREGCDRHVKLEGLDRVEVARLVADMLGKNPSPRLVDTVYEQTDGNPFLVTQTARLVMEEGRFDGDQQADQLPHVPIGVHLTVLRRVEKLSTGCREALGVGSVVGAEFSLGVVARVTGMPTTALVDVLDAAVTARILRSLPGDHRFRFQHNLTRESIYFDLGVARRMRLHGEVGDALETAHSGRLDEHVDELAHHYRIAAPLDWAEKAVDYGIRAGRAALDRYAWEDARAHFLQVLDLAAELDNDGRRRNAVEAASWDGLGDVAVSSQDYAEARRTYDKALACTTGDRLERSRVHRKIAKTYLDQQMLVKAMETLEAAAVELQPLASDDDEACREWLDGRLQMLWAYYYAGDGVGVERLMGEIGPVATSKGSALQRAGYLRCLLICSVVQNGHWASAEALGVGRMLLAAAQETGLSSELALSEALVANAFISRPMSTEQDLAEAERHSVVALRLGELSADMHSVMLALVQRATLARLRHDVRGVRRWGEECLRRPRTGEFQDYAMFGEAHLAWADWFEGDAEGAAERAERALATWAVVAPIMPYAWMARVVLLAIDAQHGRSREAAEHGRDLLGPYRQAPLPPLATALDEAIAAGDAGDDELVRLAVERAVSAAKTCRWL